MYNSKLTLPEKKSLRNNFSNIADIYEYVKKARLVFMLIDLLTFLNYRDGVCFIGTAIRSNQR